MSQFVNKFADAMNVRLKTNKEKLDEFLHKYVKHIKIDTSLIGNVRDTIKSAVKLLGEVDIETLKSRISEILKENNSKIVVFINDIDRLVKSKIFSISRLIKFTAHFSSTS